MRRLAGGGRRKRHAACMTRRWSAGTCASAFGIILVLAGWATATPADRRLLHCQDDVTSAANGLVARRQAVLARCVATALKCRGALDEGAGASPDTRCLAAAGRRCSRRLHTLDRVRARLDATGPRCTTSPPGGRGVPQASLLDADDGLGLGDLAPLCPRLPRPEDAGAASRCQAVALACGTDRALALVVPHVPLLLARLGIVPDGPRCLLASLCGNGVLDGDEDCDDGDGNSDTTPEACRTTCREPTCGDGVVDDDEECDDGNQVDGDGCDSDCTPTPGVCGNGVVDVDEECDDGNLRNDDGCDDECSSVAGAFCGDGEVADDEECDDGRANSNRLPDHCRLDCTEPRCGDGVVDPEEGEECEPPSTLLCAGDCTWRLPIAPAAISPGTHDLASCQDALLAGGKRVFRYTRVRVEECVAAVARCVLGVSANRADACLARANRRCARAAAVASALRARFVQRSLVACPADALPLARLLDSMHGLGFETLAPTCPAPPDRAPAPADLFACVGDAAGCAAESVVARIIPRAEDLLGEIELDAAEAFPCLTSPGDLAAERIGASTAPDARRR